MRETRKVWPDTKMEKKKKFSVGFCNLKIWDSVYDESMLEFIKDRGKEGSLSWGFQIVWEGKKKRKEKKIYYVKKLKQLRAEMGL